MAFEGPIRRIIRNFLSGPARDFHLEDKIAEMRERKILEWQTRGIHPNMITQALALANQWAMGTTKVIPEQFREAREQVLLQQYQHALGVVAENWLEAVAATP